MMNPVPVLSRSLLVGILLVSVPQAEAAETKVGGKHPRSILRSLGGKMEDAVSSAQLTNYARHFSRIDKDGDGRHSKAEFIEKGNYLNPQARRGIFGAADNDQDGFVTEAEYTLNRIITDEGKAIMQAMDDNKDGTIQRSEFLKYASPKLKDSKLAEQVFAALDSDMDESLRVPEYLRVWGKWARLGEKSAAVRLATVQKKKGTAPRPAGPSAGGGPPAFSAERLFRFDRNKDGKVSKDEIPESFRNRVLERVDANRDGVIEKSEAEKAEREGR